VSRTCARAALLLLIPCVACEPIAIPADDHADPASTRLEPGDPLPEFVLTDRTGNTVTPAAFLGKVTTLTFIVPGAPQSDSFLRRIDDAHDRLGADASGVGRYLVTLPTSDHASALIERDGWQSLGGDAEMVISLAARFAVLTWPGAGDLPAQTLGAAVVGPDGLIAALFGGIETWEEMDLLVAIVEAGR